VARIGFFHDNHPAILPEFPGELPPADVHGKNPCGSVLQKAISESAGGCAQIKRGHSGDIQMKMVEGVFQLVAAAADVFITGIKGKLVIGLDGIAGFAGALGVDADLSGENGAFGALAAFAKAAFNQGLIKASHVEAYLIPTSAAILFSQMFSQIAERCSGKANIASEIYVC
jgi:hypothetical protein